MILINEKIKCGECGFRGLESKLLRARNPFDKDEEIFGCPECYGIGSIIPVCDELECWSDVSCGTPTPNGYRRTCGEHRPKDAQ